MNIINATPHDIVVIGFDGTRIVYPKTEHLARVATETSKPNDHWIRDNNLLCTDITFGAVTGLPEQDNMLRTYYIVSAMVATALVGTTRYDLICPDTGPTAIRNAQGHIEAVTGFVRYGRDMI